MGCDFIYHNDTQKIETSNLPTVLVRNITRYGNTHLLNVIKYAIKRENWNTTDIIKVHCCCHAYKYENGILTDEYDTEWIYTEDACEYKNCNVCK